MMIDIGPSCRGHDKIITTAVNTFQSIALFENGLDIESLLPLWRIPDRASGQPRCSASNCAPTPDYVIPALMGPASNEDLMMTLNKNTRSSTFDPTKLILKHQMSGALDAWTSFSIDVDAKKVEVDQRTPMGEPFLSTSKLAELILDWLPQQFDVRAFNNDDVKSWTPDRTDWTIFVQLDEARLRAVVWKHRPGSGGEPRSTVELYPAPEA